MMEATTASKETKYTLHELVDIDQLDRLMGLFNKATGLAIAVIDNKGTILVAKGWQKICTDFHRRNPKTNDRCVESDLYINRCIGQGKYVEYQCKNGLVDMAAPIIIAGSHLATIYYGQFFIEGEEPPRTFFETQAKTFGFDLDRYLEALDLVPVISREKAHRIMDYYVALVHFIAETGLARYRQIEAETALRESEARFRIFADFTWDWESWMGSDGSYVYVTPSVERITGYRAEEFIRERKLLIDIVHPEDRSAFAEHLQKELVERKEGNIDFRIITRVGEERWISHYCQPVHDQGGAWLGVRASNRDVSEHKHVERELRKSETRYRAIVEDQTELICRFSLDGVLTYVNGAYCRYFGKEQEELIGNSFHPMIPEEERDLVIATLRSLTPQNPLITHEHRVITPGGDIRWHRWTNRLILDQNGNPYELQAVGRDITDRKLAEATLKEQSQKTRLFAYSVSHDLKSPAIAIHGLTKLLRDKYGKVLDEKGVEYCDKVLQASEHLVSLVQKINMYISAKEVPLHLENCRLKEVVRFVRDNFEIQFNLRNIRFVEPLDLPSIHADRTALLRIISNIVDNALKYGGSKLSTITLSNCEDEDFHIIAVEDDGVGMSGSDSNDLFEIFTRRKNSTGIEGTGLGLAIIKELAEKHGGTAWMEVNPKGGVTVSFSIAKNLS
ncbi:putative Histidine kinase [uncultured Desulfatiglans sp.]|uniref:histidine kinase n=1 Tax=Uncultured Desulfatiglans sp. TaxID=1748965 RepID=A0A653A636_UNCDX|nr:putative Histidine kinase [uncultured Desulfatiglans sp.]